MALMNNPNKSNLNVPNTLSTIRLLLALVVCGAIELNHFWLALIVFLIAVSTDWIDGWWARKFDQVTKLGRILDPFVDKVIISGTMIAIAACPESLLPAWMVTVVVGRELLVTSIRGMVEGKGGDFSANQLGKWKMVVQCAAIVALLLRLQYGASKFFDVAAVGLNWATVVITVWSGLVYVVAALKVDFD